MQIYTEAQVVAFRGLMREHDAQSIAVRELPRRAIAVTMWRDDSESPCCTATIAEHGTVAERCTVAA